MFYPQSSNLLKFIPIQISNLYLFFFNETENAEYGPVFILQASLLIPKVAIQPTLEEVQDILVLAGKNITSVSKGVGQWTGGKPPVINNYTEGTISNCRLPQK